MGKLTNLNPATEYIRVRDSFEDTIQAPLNFAANTWHTVGNSRVIGVQGAGATWLITVYFQYIEGGVSQPYFQYCGAGYIGVVYWQADLMLNEGISIAMEAHNEADFTLRFRFGKGQARKPELKPVDRAINIVAPGFLKISGLRVY